MTSEPTRPHHGGLRLGRRVLHQLRTALERDTGLQASTYLQEAGFAGGEELYLEFREWLLANRGVEDPSQLDAEFLSGTLSDFFADQGWGRLEASEASRMMRRIGCGQSRRSQAPSCSTARHCE